MKRPWEPLTYAAPIVLGAAALFTLGFRAGLRAGLRRGADVPATVAVRSSEMGLRAQRLSRGGGEYVLFYAPAGLSLGAESSAEHMAYLASEIEHSASAEKLLSRALAVALAGPSAEKYGDKVYPLAPPSAKIKKISLKNGRLAVDMSGNFSPGGGSAAMSQARHLVEETVRQFDGVKELVLTVEGRSDALEP